MTLIECIDSARKILKDKLPSTRTFPANSSSFFEDSEMTEWFNWAQLEIQNKLVQTFENWFVTSCGINIVAGTDEYVLPSGCLKIVRVEDISDTQAPVEVLPMTFNDKDKHLDSAWGDSSGNSDIEYYAIKGNRLVLRPIPSQGGTGKLKVWYSRRVDFLISASSCSTIPNEYHELLVWGIVENGLIKQEATAEAMSVVLGRRNRLVADLMTTAEDRQVQRSRQVRIKKR